MVKLACWLLAAIALSLNSGGPASAFWDTVTDTMQQPDRDRRARAALALAAGDLTPEPKSEVRALTLAPLDWSLDGGEMLPVSTPFQVAPMPRAKRAPCVCGDCCKCDAGSCPGKCPVQVPPIHGAPPPVPQVIPKQMPAPAPAPAPQPTTSYYLVTDAYGRQWLVPASSGSGLPATGYPTVGYPACVGGQCAGPR